MKTLSPAALTALLAVIGLLNSFCADMLIPALPALRDDLAVSDWQAQQTISLFLAAFAFMALWHGALADALGRRKVILASLLLFVLAAFGCIFATSIEQIWVLRAIQGASAGAGVVVSRAIVRDLFDGPAAQRLMSHITMMFAIAPAIAPVIGGRLQAWFGWRSVFVFLTAAIVLLLLACWRLLPETLPEKKRQSLHPGYLARSYWHVMTSPAFLAACFGLSFNFAGFFLYVMSAPEFLIRHLGVPETAFLWLFGPAMGGLLSGSWLSGKLAGRISASRTIRIGYLLMALAALGNLALSLWVPASLPWSVLPIPLYTLGMSLTMPSLTLLALDPFPTRRGLAASCQMFLQSTFNSVLAGMLAPALWGSTLTLALGMAGLLALGALATALHHRISRAPT